MHSCHSQYCVLDLGIVMVFQLIFFNSLISVLQSFRFFVGQVMLIQRLPFLLLAGFFIGFGRLMHALFGWHRFFVMGLKWTFRLAFFMRGIRVVGDGASRQRLSKMAGIHICNDFHLSSWLMFAYLPYDHLIIPNDAFFSPKWIRATLFLLGFYPQEHGMTPENFKAFDSRLDPYLDQGFSIWQPVFFEYRDTDALPYGVIMALKREVPIHVWKFHSVHALDRVHWLNRCTVELQLVNQVAMSRRYPLTISAFYQTISQHFGASLTQKMSDLQSAPGMPPSSTDIAREKIASAKKIAEELESEGPFQ